MNGLMISIIIHANHLSSTNLVFGGRRLSNELNGTNSPNFPPHPEFEKLHSHFRVGKSQNFLSELKKLLNLPVQVPYNSLFP